MPMIFLTYLKKHHCIKYLLKVSRGQPVAGDVDHVIDARLSKKTTRKDQLIGVQELYPFSVSLTRK